MVSPLRAGELIAGKTVPFALHRRLVDLVLITAVALLWFRVPFRGSFLLLLLAGLLFMLSRARARAAHLHRLEHPAGGVA